MAHDSELDAMERLVASLLESQYRSFAEVIVLFGYHGKGGLVVCVTRGCR